MRAVVIRLRESGQVVTSEAAPEIGVGDYVVLEVDRGFDYGAVLEVAQDSGGKGTPEADAPEVRRIVRKVDQKDLEQIAANKIAARDAMKLCSRKIREYKLPMKLVDAEYSFDQKKVVFYFTSEGRIDFRELVKDLAKVFKIRIEMRQIGVRDEARIFGGIGPCGQTLCCVRFLKNFEAVTMKMAKIQRLSLTSGKISGICGRLMCCLFYEYKTYRDLSKGLPKEGQSYDTEQGKGKVISVNVLKRLIYVQLEDGRVEKISFDQPLPAADNKDAKKEDKKDKPK